MATQTKILKKLPVDHATLERFRDAMFLRNVTASVKKVEDALAALPTDEVMKQKVQSANNEVYMPEKHAVYRADIACLMPSPSMRDFAALAFYCNTTYYERKNSQESYGSKTISDEIPKRIFQFAGLEAQLPTTREIRIVYRDLLHRNSDGYILTKNESWRGAVCRDRDGFKNFDVYYSSNEEGYIRPWNETGGKNFVILPFVHLNGLNSKPIDGTQALWFWLKYEWYPEDGFFTDSELAAYKKAVRLFKKYDGIIIVKDNRLLLDVEKIIADLRAGKSFDFIDFDAQALLKTTDLSADETFLHALTEDYLTCDQRRAMLDPYDARMLTDPNRGHWDLWDVPSEVPEDGGQADLGEGLVARDPAADVADGFIAIDFGTKSTVVAYESGPETYRPLQVGSGVYSNGVFETNYENPTIVHFLDIPAFQAAYAARAGRPATSWETMTVSHAAKQDLDTNKASAQYAEFFEGLKHWCGTKDLRVKIRDAAGNIIDLPPFLDLDDNELNPVEVYAYYIGLYMNNMLTGKCYIHYLMSFPVTYETDVREKIRSSFEKGLRKSLPTALLANEDVMKGFFVKEGTNEPAAYAITALREFGFTPEEGKQSYYAVFDFGGGTTDFDFGMLSEPPEDDERHSARLTHFGANGDRTLGGENLLRLLAFEVFKVNRAFLLQPDKDHPETKYSFTWAAEPQPFKGYEALIKPSQEAQQNMHNLMEALRPVWQMPDSEAAQNILSQGFVQVNLFTDAGEERAGVQLKLKVSEEAAALDPTEILYKRIEKGVMNFFVAMKEAFATASKESSPVKPLAETEEVAIFLAGNASRSELVTEIFEGFIDDDDDEDDDNDGKEVVEEADESDGEGIDHAELRNLLGLSADAPLPHFHLFPPLGTDEADELVQVVHEADDEPPTAKTGVAYGLLASRDGEETEVLDLTSGGGPVPFLFYVGRKRRGKFHTVLGMDALMGDWVPFIDAGGDVDILYTDKAEASRNDAPAKIAKSIHIHLDDAHRDKKKNIYIRPIAPRAIEYTIAASAADISDAEKHPEEPVRIELE